VGVRLDAHCEPMTAVGTAPAGRAGDLSESTILVVDEDTTVVDLLSAALRFQGCEGPTAATGAAAVHLARRVHPSAVICEVALPDTDGFTVLRQLRAHRITAPVVFLTACTAMEDRLTGLRVGGEDYVTKPFSLEEVVVRLRVIVRRTSADPGEPNGRVLTVADVELDERTHQVFKAGEPVALSPREFDLLRYLMHEPGVVLSKSAIRRHVWPHDGTVDVNLVETYVCHLRRKIDTGDTALLHTVRGRGYLLRAPPR
jgi:two-component system OmpR family response regulator